MRGPILLLGLLVGLVVAACGDADPGPPETTSAGEQATTTSEEVTGAATQFVLVTAVDGESLVVDPAEFLVGDVAAEAARAAGVIAAGETLPNDYYIRTTPGDEGTLPVADGRFTLIGFDATGGLVDVDVDRAELLSALRGEGGPYYGIVLPDFPMWLEVEGGEITGGRQQYVP